MKPASPLFRISVIAVIWFVIGLADSTAQIAGWVGNAPPPFATGPTVAATLRNAVQAASDQARVTAQTAVDMGRRAQSSSYLMQNFYTDYQQLLVQFSNLRSIFNQINQLVVQLQSARAANAAAELDAGLTIIAEVFAPVQQEIQAGNVNRQTVVRMCKVLNEAMAEWQKELKRNSQRLGIIR